LVCAASHLTLAAAPRENDARLAEKVKTAITSLGTCPEARVKLELRDGRKLEGCVSEISEGSFAVKDRKTAVVSTVTYEQVKKIKGNNLSTGAKIGIGVAVAVGVGIIIAIVGRGDNRNNSSPVRCGVMTPCP
jgi:hypothetical protein